MLSFLSGIISRIEKKRADIKEKELKGVKSEEERELKKLEVLGAKIRSNVWLILMLILWVLEKALQILITLLGMQILIIVVVLIGVMVVISTLSEVVGVIGGGTGEGGNIGGVGTGGVVCIGGSVNFTEEELSQYGGSMTEYDKNLYRLGLLIRKAIEGYGGGKQLNVPDTRIATRFMLGVASMENSMEFFRYSEEKDITKYPSDVKGESSGFGYLGLPVSMTLDRMATGREGEVRISPATAIGVKKEYKPASSYNYEMQYSPYSAIGLVGKWEAKYKYLDKKYEGTTSHQKIEKVMDEWGVKANREKLRNIIALCITQAQYHGAMTREHEAYAHFITAMWVATSENDSERDMDKWSLVGEGYSESPVRVSTLGLGAGGDNYTAISKYPTPDKLPQRVGRIEWALNGEKIGKPLWTYLWEKFKDKEGMRKAWNQCYSFGSGVKARVLNFHYGINSYMQGKKIEEELARKMNLPTKPVCNEVGGAGGEVGGEVVGGVVDMPPITPGKYTATKGRGQAVTVGGKTTEQLIAEYKGREKSYLQNLVPHFGYTTGFGKEDDVYGVPFYGQGRRFGESWGNIPWYPGRQTYNVSGCMVYASSYVASALTGRLINPPEMGALLIMNGGLVSGGASAGNWYKTYNLLGLQAEATGRDGSSSTFGTKYFGKIDETLAKGGLVVVRMKGPSAGAKGQPQFAAGWEHWIVINKKTSEGKYRIYTSTHIDQTQTAYTKEQLGAKMWRQLVYIWK